MSPPPLPPRRPVPPPPIEEIWRVVQELVDDKAERERNETKTNDVRTNEYTAALEARVAQLLAPRFNRVDDDNRQQLKHFEAMERERNLRHAAEAALAQRERLEGIARASKERDQRHRLKVWGVVIGLLAVLVPLATAAIYSQSQHSPTAPAEPAITHHH